MAKSSAEYWADRIAAHTWREYNSSEYDREALKRLYKDAYRDIEHDLVGLFEKAEKGEITLTEGHTIRHLSGLKKDIEKIVSNLAQEEEKQLKTYLKKHYKAVYDGIYKELPDASFASVNQKVIEKALSFPWSGADFSDAIWKNKTLLSYTLNATLTRSLVRGTSMGALAKEINGVMDSGYKNALRLARTETMHYLNDSALKAYKDAGVERVQFWAAEDERTCPECGALHGKEFPVDKAPILPIHPNCRCTYIPVVDIPTADAKYQKEAVDSSGGHDTMEPEEPIRAKTIKAAGRYAEDVLKIPHASYKGVSVEVANAWNEGLADNLRRFPELLDNFDFVGTCQERNRYIKEEYIKMVLPGLREKYPDFPEKTLLEVAKKGAARRAPRISRNVFAQSYRQDLGRGITVNSAWGKADEFVKALQYCVEVKFHPAGCNTIRSVIDHEVGHQIDDLLLISGRPEIMDLFSSMEGPEITESLSEYAWENSSKAPIREFVAEGWAEYCNNPDPRPVAKKIGELIERVYEEWKTK